MIKNIAQYYIKIIDICKKNGGKSPVRATYWKVVHKRLRLLRFLHLRLSQKQECKNAYQLQPCQSTTLLAYGRCLVEAFLLTKPVLLRVSFSKLLQLTVITGINIILCL